MHVHLYCPLILLQMDVMILKNFIFSVKRKAHISLCIGGTEYVYTPLYSRS